MILPRATLRHLRRHPLQALFAILGVALGVAVVIGIDLANQSASRAFELSASTLAGKATHQVVGGAQELPEETYARLRLEAGIRLSAPVVEGYAADPGSGLTLQVLGIDPLAEGPFRTYTPGLDAGQDFSRLIAEPGTALLEPQTAERLKLRIKDEIQVDVAGEQRPLKLIGFLEPAEQVAAHALQNMLVVDIATAQELFGMVGRISRIDLILPQGSAGETALTAVKEILPADASIIPASTRSEVMGQMTDAFRLNLTALSLLGLVVGMFLIYNTITFAVVRRRRLLGILRTLGVSRRQIFLLILGEALLIGAIGTVLGLLLGIGLAHGLLHLVTRTIEDLYFVINVQQLALSPWSLTKGLLLGMAATLVAALVPAREATNTPPTTVMSRSALEASHRRLIPRAALAGALMMVTGGILLLPGRSLLLSFVALFALIAGYALLVPALMAGLLRGAIPLSGRVGGFLGRLATRNLGASLSRTGVATAALAVAVSATIGVGVMVSSFRLTVDEWLHSYLRADIYLTTPSAGFEAKRPVLEPELVKRLTASEGVELATRARHLLIERPDGLTELFVVEVPPRSFAGYEFTGGDRERIWQSFTREAAVLVSEPYAYHHDLQRGDTIELRTDRGPVDFRVAGIFYDYGSGQGRITMERAVFARYWDEPQVDALGFYLAPGYEAEQVAAALRRQAAGRQQVLVYSNRALREASMATFDRTFRVTQVLRLLAVAVAFVGILSALMALQLERGRDLAVLRATGLTPRQVWRLVSAETALMGLLAGLLALPLGVIQALVLIFVINRRSFGWTMQTWLDPGVFLQALLLALAAALLAGLYPAWRMARTKPALALREE